MIQGLHQVMGAPVCVRRGSLRGQRDDVLAARVPHGVHAGHRGQSGGRSQRGQGIKVGITHECVLHVFVHACTPSLANKATYTEKYKYEIKRKGKYMLMFVCITHMF